jgi:hypothetical protein
MNKTKFLKIKHCKTKQCKKRKFKNKSTRSKKIKRTKRRIIRGGTNGENIICILNMTIGNYLSTNLSLHGASEASRATLERILDTQLQTLADACNEILKSNVCEMTEKIFPIYFKDDGKPGRDPLVRKYFCLIFILIGIFSIKFKEMNVCTIFLKGGKAVQGAIMDSDIRYESDDIDIGIIPDPSINFGSNNIAEIMGLLMKQIIPGIEYIVREQEDGGSIVKISLRTNSGELVPISDISFDPVTKFSPVMENVIHQDKMTKYVKRVAEVCEKYGDLLFNFPESRDLLHEHLYWLIKYHIENKNKINRNPLKNKAFIYKSSKSINALLSYIMVGEFRPKEEVLRANIRFIWSAYLKYIFPNVNEVPILKEIHYMILNPPAERDVLFVSPTLSQSSTSRSNTPYEPRVRTPLQIFPRQTVPRPTVPLPVSPEINTTSRPSTPPQPILPTFAPTPPRGEDVIRPIAVRSPGRSSP